MKRSPWIYLAIASLGLNLFFLGFFASRAIKGRPADRADAFLPFRVGTLARVTQNPELKARAREQMEALRPKRKALIAARRATRRALEATPFEREALAKSLDDLRQASLSAQSDMHAILIDLAAGLSPAERKRLAELNWSRPRRDQARQRPGAKPEAP